MTKKSAFLILLACSGAFAHAIDEAAVRDFFERQQALRREGNPMALEAVADDAKITTRRSGLDGGEKTLEMSGAQYKEMVTTLLRTGASKGDASTYANMTISVEGNRAKIKADREGSGGMVDRDYYIVLEDRGDGKLTIVEEHTHTVDTSGGAEVIMDFVVERTKGMLPAMVDADTRLDAVSRTGNTLAYQFTILNIPIPEGDEGRVAKMLEAEMTRRACADRGQKAILDKGGTLRFVYRHSGGKAFADFTIRPGSCGGNGRTDGEADPAMPEP